MDDRLSGVAAIVVGAAVAGVATGEYVLPGFPPPPLDPFTSGVLVAATGILLVVAGGTAVRKRVDSLPLRSATAVGVVTLALAVLQPDSLLFGGVFWLGLVSIGLVAVGVYRTVSVAREV